MKKKRPCVGSEHGGRGRRASVGARVVRRRGRGALGAAARRSAHGAGVAPVARRRAPPRAAVERRARGARAAARRRAAGAPRTGGTACSLSVYLSSAHGAGVAPVACRRVLPQTGGDSSLQPTAKES